jgi:hypothetical protein
MSEAAILNAVLLAVCNLPGSLMYRNNTGKLRDAHGRWVTFGLIGSGDVMGVYRGRAVAIECKALGGALRQSQRRFRHAWEAAGGVYILARSPADALAALERLS